MRRTTHVSVEMSASWIEVLSAQFTSPVLADEIASTLSLLARISGPETSRNA